MPKSATCSNARGSGRRLIRHNAMFERIFVAVDGSAGSNAALDVAVRLVREHPASLWICHVQGPLPRSAPGAAELRKAHMTEAEAELAWSQKVVAEAAARAGRAGVSASTLIISGHDVAAALVDQARRHQADLMVLGPHERGGIASSLFGDCTGEAIRKSPIPVMVAPAQAARTHGSEPPSSSIPTTTRK